MRCAPSGATPTVSTTSEWGVKDHAAARERRSLLTESPMEAVEERNRVRELYSARPEQGFSIEGHHPLRTPLELLQELSDRGEGVQTKPQPRLYHSIQPHRSWMSALDRMAAPILPQREEPAIIRFAPKHISGTSCDGEGVCIFRSLVTTSPRIWCETRA